VNLEREQRSRYNPSMSFAENLHERSLRLNTRLCLGLDPRPEMHPLTEPKAHGFDPSAIAAAVETHGLETLEACAPFIAAVKPNLAYYEALGIPGLGVLNRICANARMLGLCVILDAKRGDFPSTAEAYAKAWLTGDHAGSGLTVNPFLGFETLTPFLKAARANDGAIFVLVKTSNPGSKDLQDLETSQGKVSEVVAKRLAQEAVQDGSYGAVGAVVGATHTAELAHFRSLMPNVLILLPGLGAQGAKASDLAPAFDADGLGAIATSSRAIHYASQESNYALQARDAARGFRDELNTALGK
jgi:orotidine-5'-phosphate decarboxylase